MNCIFLQFLSNSALKTRFLDFYWGADFYIADLVFGPKILCVCDITKNFSTIFKDISMINTIHIRTYRAVKQMPAKQMPL